MDDPPIKPPVCEYVKRNEGIVAVPAKIMSMVGLELLDLSHNKIEMVPKGVLTCLPRIKVLELSHNNMKALPDDIGELGSLEVLSVGHNQLAALPAALLGLAGLRELVAGHNLIAELAGPIHLMESLQVLDLSSNRLRALPPDIGWLAGLRQLNVSGNPELRSPCKAVLSKGLKAVMSFLQVVGEQRRMIEAHMASFTAPLTALAAARGLNITAPVQNEAGALLRLRAAQQAGVLGLSNCGLLHIPEAVASLAPVVQVMDASRNRLRAVPADVSLLQRLVVLNLAHNSVAALPDGFSLPRLAALDVSCNSLRALPPDLGARLPALRQLYASSNRLESLPDSLAQAPLQDLFVGENPIGGGAFPGALGKCGRLAKLGLAACGLRGELPAAIGGMTSLRWAGFGAEGGGLGGYTTGRADLITLLRQRARPYLFSNTLAPAVAGASLAVFDILSKSTELRDKLEANTKYFRQRMTSAGFDLRPGSHPIVPIMLGDAALASTMAAKMLERGVYVVGFSYPVVPKGKARIRVQLSAAHETHHIDAAVDAFVAVGRELGVIKG
ncbi:glycine C-acetyltransferase [Monoraphidium neglectum]|uniref:Glycine C-acetyltransferase n=1 Tax=Monoraphidium neglectum TaxID=145388 RepID=A0A0D2JV70_9CHLO|nr:glycine C-acetyltransferase [Monoraphidium neglectum]KIZ02693.1 glycine C-acetyltransferase [Monoraphidium neglectum]|eukprot:XP_013901712.1 glycine C-acetyltransferase [Monoraphidium neglectum]